MYVFKIIKAEALLMDQSSLYEAMMPMAEVGAIMIGLCPDELEARLQINLGDLYVRVDLEDLGNHVQVVTGSAEGRYWVIVYVRGPMFCRVNAFKFFVGDDGDMDGVATKGRWEHGNHRMMGVSESLGTTGGTSQTMCSGESYVTCSEFRCTNLAPSRSGSMIASPL